MNALLRDVLAETVGFRPLDDAQTLAEIFSDSVEREAVLFTLETETGAALFEEGLDCRTVGELSKLVDDVEGRA